MDPSKEDQTATSSQVSTDDLVPVSQSLTTDANEDPLVLSVSGGAKKSGSKNQRSCGSKNKRSSSAKQSGSKSKGSSSSKKSGSKKEKSCGARSKTQGSSNPRSREPVSSTVRKVNLGVSDKGVEVITIYAEDKVEATKRYIPPGHPQELRKALQPFWDIVSELSISQRGAFSAHEELDIILDECTQLNMFIACDPLPGLVPRFQPLFEKHCRTLTWVIVGENGKGGGNTEFDFGWVSNCSVLTTLIILTNSNSARNFRQIPVGLQTLFSTHYASDEDVEWISCNLNTMKLESLLVWVRLDGKSNRITEPVFKNFLRDPKFVSLILLLSTPDPEALKKQLQPMKELCDSLGKGSGVKTELGTKNDFIVMCPHKQADLAFSCSIDRKKFKGNGI